MVEIGNTSENMYVICHIQGPRLSLFPNNLFGLIDRYWTGEMSANLEGGTKFQLLLFLWNVSLFLYYKRSVKKSFTKKCYTRKFTR